MFPQWVIAAFWGAFVGSALMIGSAIAYWIKVKQRVIAGVMAFSSGLLISALSFELVDKAYNRGGFDSTAIGFLSGALIYTVANCTLAHHGAKHRKRSGGKQSSETEHKGSGLAIAIGALMDGIPESIVIGLSLIEGGVVSYVAVIAIYLSNITEGLSSSAGMKRAGRSGAYIFGISSGIIVISGTASLIGFSLFKNFSSDIVAATTAVAAGAILAMLVDTMIPEAFEETHDFAGLITVSGFLVSFMLSKII